MDTSTYIGTQDRYALSTPLACPCAGAPGSEFALNVMAVVIKGFGLSELIYLLNRVHSNNYEEQ